LTKSEAIRDTLQVEVDKCRRRDTTLKTDLTDIHHRQLQDLKTHCKAKFRMKMLAFEQECQDSLRHKLSQVETSLKHTHTLQVQELVTKYDSHIKSHLMEI